MCCNFYKLFRMNLFMQVFYTKKIYKFTTILIDILILFNRKKMLQILRSNTVNTNSTIEIINKIIQIGNTGARILGKFKGCTYLVVICLQFVKYILTEMKFSLINSIFKSTYDFKIYIKKYFF